LQRHNHRPFIEHRRAPDNETTARQFSVVHDLASSLTSATYDEEVTRYAAYDRAQRLKRLVYADQNHGNAFAYDSLGRLISDTAVVFSGSNNCGDPPSLDENGSQCAYEGSWTSQGVTDFQYDTLDNRKDLGGSYGAANRIRSFDSCTYITDSIAGSFPDSLADGNVVRRSCGSDTVRFHWTANSRLRALKVVGGDSVEFAYNGTGQLIRRKVNGTARYFIWNGSHLLAELHADGSKVAEYSYYPAGLDRLHAVIVGSNKYYAHTDPIGNVIALTDSAEAVARTYTYTWWGASTGGSDDANLSGADRARFKGALWLGPQVDLYYMRNRWYEPKSGRFLSEDPVGLMGGQNLYTYAANDPLNNSDPTGLTPPPVLAVAGGGAVWAAATATTLVGVAMLTDPHHRSKLKELITIILITIPGVREPLEGLKGPPRPPPYEEERRNPPPAPTPPAGAPPPPPPPGTGGGSGNSAALVPGLASFGTGSGGLLGGVNMPVWCWNTGASVVVGNQVASVMMCSNGVTYVEQ
jgi:RHS repeat-associated protein